MRGMALTTFANEPVLELRRAAIRSQLAGALAQLDAELPLSVPVSIGRERRPGEELESTDPGEPDCLVGRAAASTEAEVAAAVELAQQAFQRWRATPATEPAAAL